MPSCSTAVEWRIDSACVAGVHAPAKPVCGRHVVGTVVNHGGGRQRANAVLRLCPLGTEEIEPTSTLPVVSRHHNSTLSRMHQKSQLTTAGLWSKSG